MKGKMSLNTIVGGKAIGCQLNLVLECKWLKKLSSWNILSEKV